MANDTASASPSSRARSRDPNPTVRKPAYSFHEPFVSPEFSARLPARSPWLDDGVARGDGGERSQAAFDGNDATNSPGRQNVPLPQAAPLYTVRAASATEGLIATPATATSDALLLGKGPPVAGPASTYDAAGLKEMHFKPKSHKTPLLEKAVSKVEAERTPQPLLSPPRDVSPPSCRSYLHLGSGIENDSGAGRA